MPAPFRLAVAALLLLVLAAAGMPDGYPPSYGTLVQASKLEGKLVVYTTLPATRWAPLLQGFKHLYPWLTVQTLVLAPEAMMPRYAEEKAAMGTTADLMVNASAEAWAELAAKGDVLPYDSPAATPAARVQIGLYRMLAEPAAMLA